MIKTKSLIKQLNKAAKNLSEENKKIFYDIVLYIRTSNIKTRDGEEFLQQILDSFLNAEQQGVSIETMLGTTDIKQYCEEIVTTYKASYNYLSRCSEYIMYTGMFITILSFMNYIMQNFNIIKSYKSHSFTLYLNFDLGLIFQFLIIILTVIICMADAKKSCFKKTTKFGEIKQFLILWIFFVVLISIMVLCNMFLPKILFRLNIIVVLIMGIVLYFIGNYLSEK